MAKNSGKLDDDVDALFKLPVTEFTGARNTLAAQLKKAGRGDEAVQVKALAKPSVSAWAVNQIYWQQRKAFDELISTGQRFRKAQTAGKVAEIHGSLEARREALSHLSQLAMTLLRDAGHNPSPDTERRVTTTLEALSVYAALPGGPDLGRLTHDVDPPGFDSLASLMSGAAMPKLTLVPSRVAQSPKPGKAAAGGRRKIDPAEEARRLKEERQAGIAAAKAALREAKKSLTEAQAKSQKAEAAQKKAGVEAKQAEKEKQEAEQRFQKARFASEDAIRRVRSAAAEVEETNRRLERARLAVEKAEGELEELIQA